MAKFAIRRAIGAVSVVAAFGVVDGVAQSTAWIESEIAVLQGMDKITARISTFEVPVDGLVRFGTLEIIARRCRKQPPEEPPESAAYLEIEDVKPGEPPERIFRGWMFASSPALSALEHPVYDVWVIDCRKPTNTEESNSE